MKKLLLVFFLACGATAMANNTDPFQEKRINHAHVHTVKETAKTAKTTAVAAAKPETVRVESSHVSDNSRYGLGTYIVEFINRSNVKIMRRLLID